MASTSSSSSSAMVTSPRRNYYDVFVSFRGKDTRFNFTDHLFAALQRKCIFAFRDDTKINKGEFIAPELLRAIQDSNIFIVVFSKNYASSTWCLRELECILQCFQHSGKQVLPVFYDVDPSEVRHQKENYAEAFSKHEERFKHDLEVVQRWRVALTQVANLSGWDVRHKPQNAEIEKIVEVIINMLGYKFSNLPKNLVGMHSPIHELEKHLLLDSLDDVRVVGICGMGGIGKTTLATILYNKISHQFPVLCLIDDLSKTFRDNGPIGAQKLILHQTLIEEQLQACNIYNACNLIQSRLHGVKALIILDNVDQVEQLEKLAVNREWLGAGSRIIIVSRDEHILKEYGVDVVYKVPLMNRIDSFQLFSRKAFKLDHIMSSYNKLAFDILRYANGLPLSIKVLGSFLYDRNIFEWKSALARLRESPNKDIMDVLRLSFDGLEEMEKEIFLHIACFFKGGEEKYVKNILNCCGFHADIGLRVLIDKSLISISGENSIEIHRLLQELGRKIVQEKSTKETRKWSKLWIHKQFYNVTSENMEKKVEAIVFVRGKKETKVLIMAEALSKMTRLRLLILKRVICTENLSCLSNELRYVEWDRYPFKYLPSNFQPNQLVRLILRHSNVKQLWKEKKYLPNLKTLDLSHSKNLRKMPNFREIPNLERLSFEGCVKLVKMDPSIGVLSKLVFLNLKDCKNLVSIPSKMFGLHSLECLNLSGCPKLFKNPTKSSTLKRTVFCFCHFLNPYAHKDFASRFLHSLLRLSCLNDVDISFCGISQLPSAIGRLCRLERLNLGGNNFVTVPSLKKLSRLAYLNLQHCKFLTSLPLLPFATAIDHDLHINNLEKNKSWKSKGLVIFNCPKLSEREGCSSMMFSWMLQLIQANPQSSSDVIQIVTPGSEIPSWFINQRKHRSIPIDLSPIMHDDSDNKNFIGIACCAVFSAAPTLTTYAKIPAIMINFSNRNTRRRWYGIIAVILEKCLIEVKSDHMCLIYFPLESFFNILKFIDETLGNLDNFNMKFSIMNRKGLHVKVRSCGYHWVYKQNHASLPKFHSSDTCKFLEIEDEAQTQLVYMLYSR